MLYTLRFFSSKRSLFHNANFFGSCIIHILYTGCAKIKKNNSGSKRLKKIRPMGKKMFHADGRTDGWTDRHDEANSRIP